MTISVLDKVLKPGIVSVACPEGNFTHELAQYRSDKSCVLDLAPPLYYPNHTKIYDRSPYGNHGTTNATWAKNSQGLWYLSHDGTDDVTTVSNHASLNITGNITVELWGYPIAEAANDSPLNKVTAGSAGYMLYHASGGTMYFFCYGLTVTSAATAAGTTAVGNWYHFVGRYNGSAIEIWVNGVLKTSTPSTGTIGATANNLLLCKYATDYANWGVALPRVYNRALGDAEIQNHYQQERHLFGI